MIKKIYGPYLRKDGRKHILIYFLDGTRKTVSYPKWLMEQHLGRKLEEWETVDHINRDKADDRIENFQILDKSIHTKLDIKRVKFVEVSCVKCENKFMVNPTKSRERGRKGKSGPFCTRRCSGLYGTDIQNGRAKKLDPQPFIKTEYYYLDK